ncbi:hypothetical protein [Rickettsiella endosymbiont of Dermanyssus gallinae]|uniref:hypothetical protein n=1 Tax=Rickettsiella endosymbiont of Dermanyssus gallinae TaxID=2856608 RepID=UPI001C52F8E9|nr:hypothetical protein [Rickettsiella endosymbiont of Dermanyssus gallinae]
MTANVILNQFDPIRQTASDYLSQCYQILARLMALIEELEPFQYDNQSKNLTDLIGALNMFLCCFQVVLESAHNALDEDINPYHILGVLNTYQTIGTAVLTEGANELIEEKDILLKAVDDIAIYDGFDTYSSALAKEDN